MIGLRADSARNRLAASGGWPHRSTGPSAGAFNDVGELQPRTIGRGLRPEVNMVKRLVSNSLLIAAGAFVLTACATLTVRSDVNTALYHPGQCHTFAWAGTFPVPRNGQRSSVANPVNESRLRSAIAAHLQALGVRPVPLAANADCLVGYGIGSRTVVEDFGPYWDPGPWGWGGWGGWGYGWGPYWGGWGWGAPYPYVYHEGVIGVDLYDGRTHEALWHAQVNQNLEGATGTDAEQKINVAVSAIFAKFPG
jgi:hypothetical protein